LVSQTQGAWLIGVQRGTIQYWEQQGKLAVALPSSPLANGPGRPRRLYRLDDIIQVAIDRGRFLWRSSTLWAPNYLILLSVNNSPVVEFRRTPEGAIYRRSLQPDRTPWKDGSSWEQCSGVSPNSLAHEWLTGEIGHLKEDV